AVRQKTNRYLQRFGRNFGTVFALWPVVAGAIGAGARTASIAFRAFVAAVRLPRAAPVAVPAPWTVGTALAGIRILALKIGGVISPRRFVRPGGQHFQVEQIFGGSGRRHPFSCTPSESEVNCPSVSGTGGPA